MHKPPIDAVINENWQYFIEDGFFIKTYHAQINKEDVLESWNAMVALNEEIERHTKGIIVNFGTSSFNFNIIETEDLIEYFRLIKPKFEMPIVVVAQQPHHVVFATLVQLGINLYEGLTEMFVFTSLDNAKAFIKSNKRNY